MTYVIDGVEEEADYSHPDAEKKYWHLKSTLRGCNEAGNVTVHRHRQVTWEAMLDIASKITPGYMHCLRQFDPATENNARSAESRKVMDFSDAEWAKPPKVIMSETPEDDSKNSMDVCSVTPVSETLLDLIPADDASESQDLMFPRTRRAGVQSSYNFREDSALHPVYDDEGVLVTMPLCEVDEMSDD